MSGGEAGPEGRPFNVLVIGGTGVFGRRLCRLLAGDSRIALTAAARDGTKVAALAVELGIAGRTVDWRRDLEALLASGAYDAVVHAAGPFQGQDYTVARACVRHRVHYLDIADDSAFVCGIDQLDSEARAAGVLVCAGASTAPALTAAVVEAALQGGAPVDRVSFGIMPGNDAPRGHALVQAILSRAGKPIADQPGRRVWGDLRRLNLPGRSSRWISACDLPEPALFARYFGIRDTYAGAGLELTLLHHGLWALALLVRAGFVRSLERAAAPLAWLSERFRAFGTDCGGLRIDLDGHQGRRTWSAIAEGGDGPFIPVTPAAALLRKLARGEVQRQGAMPCVGLLSFAEIEAEWRRAHLRIASGWGEDESGLRPSLYRRALGGAYDRMSAAGRAFHDAERSDWHGRCSVDGPVTLPGKVLAWMFGLPGEGRDAPIGVTLRVCGNGETWIRRVAGRTMRSRQFIGARKPPMWIVEKFGPLEFDLAVSVLAGRLELVMSGMRFAGLPLPRPLRPLVKASETEEGGRFCFDVDIGLPLIGRLVRYRGWITGR